MGAIEDSLGKMTSEQWLIFIKELSLNIYSRDLIYLFLKYRSADLTSSQIYSLLEHVNDIDVFYGLPLDRVDERICGLALSIALETIEKISIDTLFYNIPKDAGIYKKHLKKFEQIIERGSFIGTSLSIFTKPFLKEIGSKSFCKVLLRKESNHIKCIPATFLTKEMVDMALEENIDNLRYVPAKFQTLEFCKELLQKDPRSIRFIKKQKQTEELCLYALELSNIPLVFEGIHKDNRSKAVWLKYLSENAIRHDSQRSSTGAVLPGDMIDKEFIDIYMEKRMNAFQAAVKEDQHVYTKLKALEKDISYFKTVLSEELLIYLYEQIKLYPSAWMFHTDIDNVSTDQGYEFLEWYERISGKALNAAPFLNKLLSGDQLSQPDLLIATVLSQTFRYRPLDPETKRFDYKAILKLYANDIRQVFLEFNLRICDLFSGEAHKDSTGISYEGLKIKRDIVGLKLSHYADKALRKNSKYEDANFKLAAGSVELTIKSMGESGLDLYLTLPLTADIYYLV